MLFRTSASILALFACTGLAAAADLDGPLYGGSLKDDSAPTAAHSWTGLYVGGNFGYLSADLGWHNINQDRLVDLDPNGWFGGIQVGYNQQLGSVVLGIEADYQWADANDGSFREAGAQPITVGPTVSIDSFATVRGRVGLAIDRAMPYLTAGYAWADIDTSFRRGLDVRSDSTTHSGWVYGGGLELALRPDLSVKAEFLHFDLDKEHYLYDMPAQGQVPATVDPEFQIYRVGVNYRFGFGN